MADNFKAGLVLEGGGSRAIFTSGVLDVFIKNKIEFPYVIGVSAGSCNGASFLGKNYRRQHDITINYCNDRRYMSVESAIRNGEYINTEWIFTELTYNLIPLDYDEYDKSGAKMCVVVTNAETGRAEYFYPDGFREIGCAEIRASCSLPLATKGFVINGTRYFDGGVADSIPLERALSDGCQKAVVILTQDREYVKKPVGHDKIVRTALRKHPALAQATLDRHIMYNNQRKFIEEQEKLGRCLVIRPPKSLDCSSVEKNLTKLERIYQLGVQQGEQQLERVRSFLAE